jgi:tetratricopeptide (TPR) repeat protein
MLGEGERMRVGRLGWVLVAAALGGCEFGGALPADPIAKAPSIPEELRSCPLPEPDFAGLRARLAEGAFEPIEAALAAMREAYAGSPACESYLWMATRNLADEDFALLDAWVAARPDSAGAYTTRGARWVDTGYARRGDRSSNLVTDAQWDGMREAFAHADRDLRRAIELDPKLCVAHGYAIHMLQAGGDTREIVARLNASLALDPLSVGVRKRAIQALSPKWGGSLGAMRTLAEEAQRFAGQNPRLRMLPGMLVAEAGQAEHDRKEYARAVQTYRKALAWADERDWYDGLAHNLDHVSAWGALATATKQWIELAGDDAAARFYLGKALVQSDKAPDSLEHFDRAHALWPRNIEYLRWRGYARKQAGLFREAAEDLRLAVAADPSDEWSRSMLSELGSAPPAPDRVAQAAPAQTQGAPAAERKLPGLSRLGLSSSN